MTQSCGAVRPTVKATPLTGHAVVLIAVLQAVVVRPMGVAVLVRPRLQLLRSTLPKLQLSL
jgi:hypothetical protein